LEDAEPVAVAQDFVFGIDGGHRVLEVEDGGQRGFEHHVGDAGRVGGADGGAAIEHDLEMQPVVLQQQGAGGLGLAAVAQQLAGVAQAGVRAVVERHLQLAALHAVAARVFVRLDRQRRRLVEEVACKLDHARAAQRVVAAPALAAAGLRNGVGAVERVVERAPARVGGVERVARVQDRHHQLRPGLQGQFGVHIGGAGAHAHRRRHQVADALEELAVGGQVGDGAGVRAVPAVQLGLQAIALGQQGGVFGRQIGDDGIEPGPEGRRIDAGAGQHLLVDKFVQGAGYVQAADGGAGGGHESKSSYEKTGGGRCSRNF